MYICFGKYFDSRMDCVVNKIKSRGKHFHTNVNLDFKYMFFFTISVKKNSLYVTVYTKFQYFNHILL